MENCCNNSCCWGLNQFTFLFLPFLLCLSLFFSVRIKAIMFIVWFCFVFTELFSLISLLLLRFNRLHRFSCYLFLDLLLIRSCYLNNISRKSNDQIHQLSVFNLITCKNCEKQGARRTIGFKSERANYNLVLEIKKNIF